MTTRHVDAYKGVSRKQLDLIERFEADYNAVDQILRKALDRPPNEPFTELIRKYAQKHAGWQDADLLRRIAKVRNVIVHDRTEPYRYVAIPLPAIGEDLKACLDRVSSPARAIPTFERSVEKISPDDNLVHVLEIISQRDYSQFPVYAGDRFRGLLTENGITRWFAHYVSSTLSPVDLEKVPVRHVLKNEEQRRNYCFVAPDFHVEDVKQLFGSHELLEAVLISPTGDESEALLGIATRWDIIHNI